MISRPLIEIEIYLFVHIPPIYEHLFYKKIVSRSVHQATKGIIVKIYIETRFSQSLIEFYLFLCTLLSYLSIYSLYILSVGLAVRLQKAEM